MSQTIVITLSIAGTDTGPFNLYTCTGTPLTVTCSTIPFQTNVPKASLEAGYVTAVPDGTTYVKVVSQGACTNDITLPVTGTPPTTTTTSSTTSTTTTIEYVTIYVYARHKPFSVDPPEMTIYSTINGGADWCPVGTFSDTNCSFRGAITVPKFSPLEIVIVDGSNLPWISTRTVNSVPDTCPAFDGPNSFCQWPIFTNMDRWVYFTVWNEDTGTPPCSTITPSLSC